MLTAEVQFTPWDASQWFSLSETAVGVGEVVIVKTAEGQEAGRILAVKEASDNPEVAAGSLLAIERKASEQDLKALSELAKQKEEVLTFAQVAAKRLSLAMKLVDVHLTFDNNKIVFAFIADGRVDFRELVKELTRHWRKNIRLQQLGVRDEVRLSGDVGSCGRTLCCRTNLHELCSISSDLMELQQISHRGSERMAGVCGRLRCCLAYEQNVYEDLAKKLPALGSLVMTAKGKGEVIRHHVIKGTVDVRIDADNIVEHKV